MPVHELLMNRKSEITQEIEKLQVELTEIDRALSVLQSRPVAAMAGAGDVAPPQAGTLPKKDEAIIDAVKAGNRTPAQISEFIRKKLGVDVNDASTRTRLSRMKAAGKIEHDGYGWKTVGK